MKHLIVLSLLVFHLSLYSENKAPFILKKSNGFISKNKFAANENGNLAIGLKFYPLGFTAKYQKSEKLALEGLFYFWYYGTRLTGLVELHQKIEALSGSEGVFKVYAGGGAHLGFINNRTINRYKRDFGSAPGSIYAGIDGVLGIDFRFNELPINLSLDWQPSISFYGFDELDLFQGGWGGLSIRYILK